MKKMRTIYQRNYDTDHLVRDEVTPGCEWVFAGEGRATRKYDGVCCMIDEDQRFWKRRAVKSGTDAPPSFVAVDADSETRQAVGWVPVDQDDPQDKWLREAWDVDVAHSAGTYEMCGPKVNGNPEHCFTHLLVPHGVSNGFFDLRWVRDHVWDFASLRDWLEPLDIEGIVWHHPDGRMAKIKKRDFGLQR